jgi:hypothetical protein
MAKSFVVIRDFPKVLIMVVVAPITILHTIVPGGNPAYGKMTDNRTKTAEFISRFDRLRCALLWARTAPAQHCQAAGQ